jgi:two-component system response regulator FixJ
MQHGGSRSHITSRAPIVFIVENDDGMRASLAFLLESTGVATATFETAEAFVAACSPDDAGCLLLDVRLPGMSGVALQEQLEQLDIKLPVIIMTGFADVDTAVRVLKRGAFDFFEKPLADELLLERVRQAIAFDQHRRAIRAERDSLAARLARLTARERAVFDQVVQGKANKVVAIEFGISEKTVEAHRARVMHKLGASSLAELVRMDLAASQLESLRGLHVPSLTDGTLAFRPAQLAHA